MKFKEGKKETSKHNFKNVCQYFNHILYKLLMNLFVSMAECKTHLKYGLTY